MAQEMNKITWEELYATVGYDQHIDWKLFFDERQRKEVEFDGIYADSFAHGTDGHNARLIIAKMANLLDLIQTNITFHKDIK